MQCIKYLNNPLDNGVASYVYPTKYDLRDKSMLSVWVSVPKNTL